MNINSLIISTLSSLGYPVKEDIYEGTGDKYIVFTYEDENPSSWGDNSVLSDTAYIQLQFICPKNFNYHTTKTQIRNLLEASGFIVTNIQSMLGSKINGAENIRQVIFEAKYTDFR